MSIWPSGLFDDAEKLRTQLGDEAFFRQPQRAGGGERRLGHAGSRLGRSVASRQRGCRAAWRRGACAAGRRSGQTASSRPTVEVAGGTGRGVRLARRWAVDHQPARQGVLGYDAVILFLDELILWLASHAADLGVRQPRRAEAGASWSRPSTADRPIPIISFVARQRDLRELVGEHVTGAQQLAFADVLNWWEARFHTITLEDRNLPAIAERRVLKPKSEAAQASSWTRPFARPTTVRQEVMDTLLTSTANREMFRQVYPFSPALVQTLVAVSSVLQRERTALKVMLQLLVDQRDTLKLGDRRPGRRPLRRDRPGRRGVQRGHARPLRQRQAAVPPQAAADARKDAQPHARRSSGAAARRCPRHRVSRRRPPDQDAAAGRARAGSRGAEGAHARPPRGAQPRHHPHAHPGTAKGRRCSGRLRRWAAQVGEIKLSDDANPTVSIQITGVDTESIIEQARNIDNAGNRQRKVREILFHELGVTDSDELFPVHEFEWRGTARSCEILYTNVRELSDDSLKPRDEDTWRIAIDYPFDVDGKTPNDDLARLQDFTATGVQCRTLVWLPAFLSRESLEGPWHARDSRSHLDR